MQTHSERPGRQPLRTRSSNATYSTSQEKTKKFKPEDFESMTAMIFGTGCGLIYVYGGDLVTTMRDSVHAVIACPAHYLRMVSPKRLKFSIFHTILSIFDVQWTTFGFILSSTMEVHELYGASNLFKEENVL